MLLDRPIQDVPGDRPRKWLFDDSLEVIVWYTDDQQIHGFQIVYDLRDHPKALTYKPQSGLSHHAIDPGDQNPNLNQTPILVEASPVDLRALRSLFQARASALPEAIRTFVGQRLSEATESSP